MSITTPEFFELSNFKCDFTGLQDEISPYAIGFTKKDGLWWSVVFSFLFPVKDLSNFKARVSKLYFDRSRKVDTSTSEKGIEDLYYYLKKYNPFRNRYSCFYKETLRFLVRKFETKICDHILNEMGRCVWIDPCNIFGISCSDPTHQHEPRNRNTGNVDLIKIKETSYEYLHFYLRAACHVLECNIALCDVIDGVVKLFEFRSVEESSERTLLTLYTRSEKDNPTNKFFCYGIEREFGMHLQKEALNSTLRAANIFHKNAEHIVRSVSPNDNIILTLVEKNMYSIVWVLFKQPHVLFKLEEAGYNVDPSIPDHQGTTALCYALKSNREDIVHLFYNYLSGAAQLSGASPRKPEESIPENLEHLRSILKEHIAKFQTTKSKKCVVFLEQLIKFNLFQATLVTEVLKVKTADEHYSCLPYEHGEVEKKKLKVIAILSTYADYLNYEDVLVPNQDATELSDFEKFPALHQMFKKYERYHQILDFNAALLFFDNLFSLKQNIVLENNSYETIESTFFLYILTCSFYSFSKFFRSSALTKKIEEPGERNPYLLSKSSCYYIVHMERLRLYKSVKCFKEVLSNTQVKDDNIRKTLQESDLETLTSLPKIHDVIISRAVLNYLDVVSKIQEEIVDEQVVLLIERVLQVIGESLNDHSADCKFLGESLLVSVLPVDVRKNLRDIRDELSHVDGRRVECRKIVEANKDIFKGIKAELVSIKSKIEQTHCLLELLESEFAFHEGHKKLKRIQSMLRKNQNFSYADSKHDATQLYKIVRKDSFIMEHVVLTVKEKISTFSHHNNLREHFNSIYHYMFETQTTSKTNRQSKVLFHLSCIKVLLIHITEVKKEPKCRKKVIEAIDEIERIAENHFGTDKVNTKEIKETIDVKTEFVLGKYAEMLDKKFKPLKIKEMKSKRRIKNYVRTKKMQDITYCGHDVIQKSYSLDEAVSDVEETEQMNENIDSYPCIEKLAKALKHCYPVTEKEKKYISSSVPVKFKEHSTAKRTLLEMFQQIKDNDRDPNEEMHMLIQKLIPSRKRNELEKDFRDQNLIDTNIYILKSIVDHYGCMIQKLDSNEMINGSDFDLYCENLELRSDQKAEELLKKCVKGGEPFRPKNDAVLKYLRDKVIILEKLLIKSNPSIDRMWPQVKSSKTKQHIVYRIKERYIRDFSVKCAVEMLLFDCANILENRADLKRLWIKASNLFNGINLRNVLAHGNPLFEEVGRILDPDDLPSEIISKCLELVDDKKAIEAMCELCEKIDGTREDFVAAVKARKGDWKDLCDEIMRVEKWESYSALIPSSSKLDSAQGKRKKRHESGKRH